MQVDDIASLTAEHLLDLSEHTLSGEIRVDGATVTRADIYRAAYDKFAVSENEERVKEMRWEILLWDLNVKQHGEPRFGPLFTGTTSDGLPWRYPDPENDFSSDAVTYYRSRADATSNPIMRARYADFVWERKRKGNHRCAKLAAQSYLDACPFYFSQEEDLEIADAVDRALTLAMQIAANDITTVAIAQHLVFMERLGAAGRYRWCADIIDSLLRHAGRGLDDVDVSRVLQVSEAAITYYGSPGPVNFLLQRRFLELQRDMWKIRKDPDRELRSRERIAQSYMDEAAWIQENQPHGHTFAARSYEEALKLYQELGKSNQEMEELKNRIREALRSSTDQYGTLKVDLRIPDEAIDPHLNLYRGQSAETILGMLSVDRWLLPSYDFSLQLASEMATEFPLLHQFTHELMHGDLRVKRVESDDEKIQLEAIRTFRTWYKIYARLLVAPIFETLREGCGRDASILEEAIMQRLSDSAALGAPRLEILRQGLRAFARAEYIAAIHVLVIQIEGVVRDLLALLGTPTYTIRQDVMSERTLATLIESLEGRGIDENLLRFVEVFLADRRGDNLRNEVGHALLPAERFDQENAELLVLILLQLTAYGLAPTDEWTFVDTRQAAMEPRADEIKAAAVPERASSEE